VTGIPPPEDTVSSAPATTERKPTYPFLIGCLDAVFKATLVAFWFIVLESVRSCLHVAPLFGAP
jgi:hypothetical protein